MSAQPSHPLPETGSPVSIGVLSIDQVREHPANPRKTFDVEQLKELSASILEVGVLNPILVRPQGNRYEILAGHRRFRAAQAAGLKTVPVMIRALDDRAAMEVMLVDNLQRSDLHPLEEAEGYRQLMTVAKYDAARIAERVGRSPKYVYDRVKLLHLGQEGQKAFRDGRITAGHAILLSRLKPEDQKRAFEAGGGVFETERLLWDPTEDRSKATAMRKDDALKARSVRELQGWINEHVRFDTSSPDLPDLFPETAVVVVRAQEEAEKVIPITHDHYVQPSAKDGSRTWGPQSWRRADGKAGSKTCEHSITGVIAVGPGRGEAFKVCTEKKRCKAHWGREMRETTARAKRLATSSVKKDPYEAQRRRDELAHKREEFLRKRFAGAAPAIVKALATAIQQVTVTPTGQIATIVIGECRGHRRGPQVMNPGKTAESILRYAAFCILEGAMSGWMAYRDFPKAAKALGIDVEAILAEVAPLVPTCRDCGCTEEKACEGGCSWVERPDSKTGVGLCSACAPAPAKKAKGKKA